ncbi:UNVERIFIED_CONTAM: hypothetical protein NCL1_04688 [Trichonephila clavipes]
MRHFFYPSKEAIFLNSFIPPPPFLFLLAIRQSVPPFLFQSADVINSLFSLTSTVAAFIQVGVVETSSIILKVAAGHSEKVVNLFSF